MTLEQRLDAMESRSAITDLVHAYARAVRRELYEEVAALFTPDGTFEVRGGHPDREEFTLRDRFTSPQALVAFLVRGRGQPHPVPLIHNLMVELDGDRATASSVMAAPIYGTAHEVFGEYSDSFARVDGRWLFSARVYTVFGG